MMASDPFATSNNCGGVRSDDSSSGHMNASEPSCTSTPYSAYAGRKPSASFCTNVSATVRGPFDVSHCARRS